MISCGEILPDPKSSIDNLVILEAIRQSAYSYRGF